MSAMILAILFIGIGAEGEATNASGIDFSGRWYTEEQKSIIEIYDCGDGTPCGRVEWIDPNKDNIFHDNHNKDPELRGRPMAGAIILKGFKKTDWGWDHGEIYNPKNGKTYRAKIKQAQDGELLVSGCVGPICKGLRWTEASK